MCYNSVLQHSGHLHCGGGEAQQQAWGGVARGRGKEELQALCEMQLRLSDNISY